MPLDPARGAPDGAQVPVEAEAVPALPFKVSTLVYVTNPAGEVLLLRRRKAPNEGLWSAIGGKLEMAVGESPYEAAMREAGEEIGLELTDGDLHLFAMIAEKNYEGSVHWLMFVFHCRKTIDSLPPPMDEGEFRFFREEDVTDLPIPETDRAVLWPLFREKRHAFTALRADCSPGAPPRCVVEETVEQRPGDE